MQSLWHDLVFAACMVRRQRGFAAAVVATLAVGIGANSAIFSVVNGLALRPLPVSRPDELVGIYTSDFSGTLYGTSSFPDVVDIRAGARTLQGVAATMIRPLSLDTGGTADRVFAEAVTASYFDVLGVRPAIGRTFDRDAVESSGVAVIGDRLWRRRFGADPAVVGRAVTLSGRSFTIVGVAPPEYPGLLRGLVMDVWIPLAALPAINPDTDLDNRGDRSLLVMGRRAPGVTVEQVQAEIAGLSAALHAAYPDHWRDVRGNARTMSVLPESRTRLFPSVRGAVLGFMTVLMVVVGLVLLVACANVANLLLARAAGRSREIATRLALGASRGRLVRQLLTEGLLLASLGGAAGLLVAHWGVHALMAFQPPVPVPVRLDVGLDVRVLVVAAAMTLATAILCGLAPALAATRPAVAPALKDGALVASRGRKSRLRHLLVVTQVTVSIVLLAGAGLFLRSLQHATSIDPGFNPTDLALAGVDLGVERYSEARGARFYRDLLERVLALPGVRQATWTSAVPLGLDFGRRGLSVEGHLPRDGEEMEFGTSTVGPGYFDTMGIRLVHGRDFTGRDEAGTAGVAIVNETFARRFWPGQDPIGRRIAVGSSDDASSLDWREVIGVAADGKYGTLGEAPQPFYYLPLYQVYEPSATLVARTSVPAAGFFEALKAAVAALDPRLPLLDRRTMRDHLSLSLLPARAAGAVLGVTGGVGLLLATLGLYAVMAYGVARRTREIGIRLSLGASPSDVFRLVLRQGLTLTAIGAFVGLGLSWLAAQALSSFLYGIGPADPVAFAGVVLVLAAPAVVASAVPARRAMRVDPIVALRQE